MGVDRAETQALRLAWMHPNAYNEVPSIVLLVPCLGFQGKAHDPFSAVPETPRKTVFLVTRLLTITIGHRST